MNTPLSGRFHFPRTIKHTNNLPPASTARFALASLNKVVLAKTQQQCAKTASQQP
jgi:hypothetical protein